MHASSVSQTAACRKAYRSTRIRQSTARNHDAGTDKVNEYVDQHKPWELAKARGNKRSPAPGVLAASSTCISSCSHVRLAPVSAGAWPQEGRSSSTLRHSPGPMQKLEHPKAPSRPTVALPHDRPTLPTPHATRHPRTTRSLV